MANQYQSLVIVRRSSTSIRLEKIEMLRFAVLVILLAAVCAVPINDVAKSADVEVIVVDSIDEYLTQNPEIELLERLEKEEVQEPDRVQITYTLGRRVNGKIPQKRVEEENKE